MDIILDQKDVNLASIKIKMGQEDYQPEVDKKINEYKRKVNIKGFRKGKVPASLVKQLYGKSILFEEVNKLLSTSLNDYIVENKLNIVGNPLPAKEKEDVADWDNPTQFEFNFDIGIIPEFELELSKKDKFNTYTIKVDESVLQETIENLQKQYASVGNPDSVEKEDVVIGVLKQKEGDFIKENANLPFNWLSDKLQKQFLGSKIKDTVSFEIEKAFKDENSIHYVTGIPKEEALKMTGTFTFTISKINRSIPAEVNENFFKQVFPGDDIKDKEGFKNKLKEAISKEYEKETEALLQKQVYDELIKKTKVKMPDEFIKRWLVQQNGKLSAEEIEKDYDEYAKGIKWSYIERKIAEKNDIHVEENEVFDRAEQLITQQVMSMGMTSPEMLSRIKEYVNEYLRGENGKNYEKIFRDLLAEKVYVVIKNEITINDKEVSLDKFKELIEKENKKTKK